MRMKTLLQWITMVSLASTAIHAQTNMPADAHPKFEVATIKPSDPADTSTGFHTSGRRVSIENQPLRSMFSFAYGIHKDQIAGAPTWFETDKYDIDGVPDVEGEPSLKQYQEMVRAILADRFHVKFRTETRQLNIYSITIAKGGPKIKKTASAPNSQPDQTTNSKDSQLIMRITNNTMDEFALGMQFFMNRPIVNQTGLDGRYDFTLTWTPDSSQTTDGAPGIFTAAQEQLGLKIEATKGPAQVYIIDHIERPSEN